MKELVLVLVLVLLLSSFITAKEVTSKEVPFKVLVAKAIHKTNPPKSMFQLMVNYYAMQSVIESDKVGRCD